MSPRQYSRRSHANTFGHSPYRFEAGWDAFEFAYHVVDSHAKLVIVTMSWSTREDARTFSCTPAEPDMETLTYWAQRLEPVIRKERRDEIIFVFCNRCGREDKVVYAGTSAVIGIKEGEVNVYGLLGRGVKDLLVVDTDVAPFAKLVNRPEVETTGSTLAMRQNRTKEWLAQGPFTSNSADDEVVEKPGTPAIDSRVKPIKQSQPLPIVIPRLSEKFLPLETSIDESPLVATPTAPSPMPYSRRTQIDNSFRNGKEDQTQRAESRNDENLNQLTSSDSGQISEKYFWLPTQPDFQHPMDAVNTAFHAVSPITKSSLLRIPGNKRHSMKHLTAPELALSPELDGTLYNAEPNSLRESQEASHRRTRGRNSTQNGDDPALQRPASPKSRNASRTGWPLDRRSSDAKQADLSGTLERLDSLLRKPSSSIGDQYRHARPRTPTSRPASRIGRASTTPSRRDITIGKDSDFETPIFANSSIFSEITRNSQSDTLSMSTGSLERKSREPGTIRPCLRAGPRSRNRTITAADSSHTQSRTASLTRREKDGAPHIELDESRTMIWSELSKLVGEVLQRPKSSDASSDRQQVPLDNFPMTLRHSQSGVRGVRGTPREDRRVVSQDRQADMRSRTERSTVSRMTGVESTTERRGAYGSEDEIVAEIIFHGQGCPTHSHRHQTTRSRVGTPGQVEASKNSMPVSMSNAAHRQTQGPAHSPRGASQRQCVSRSTPMENTSLKKTPSLGRLRSEQNNLGPVINPKISAMPKWSSRQAASGSCPPIKRPARRTITTIKHVSPAPTPPRVFEPTTPKAMKLDPGFDADVELATRIVRNDDLMMLKSHNTEISRTALRRPRSAIW